MERASRRSPALIRGMKGATALLAGVLALAGGCQRQRARNVMPLPSLMIWAWERAEDLRFLAGPTPSSTPSPTPSPSPRPLGVAVLRAHVFLAGNQLAVRRRVGALRLPEGTVTLPVIRIEADRAPLPTLDEAQRAALRQFLVAEARAMGLGRLQLDYEALASQRDFYARLLTELRTELGEGFVLSVTALASWCLGDRWMAELPVDEIVPMFYRLGREGPLLRARLRRGVDLAPECRGAHGLITDESMTPPPTPRRLYLFSPASWQPVALVRALDRLAQAASKESP